jgi:hypothetical protein
MKKASILEWVKKLVTELLSSDTKKPAAQSAPEKKEPYVYVTVKGKKFHYDILCPGLRNSNAVKMDLSKARKAGYTACDKCCYNYLRD